jgi:hypothetical protein
MTLTCDLIKGMISLMWLKESMNTIGVVVLPESPGFWASAIQVSTFFCVLPDSGSILSKTQSPREARETLLRLCKSFRCKVKSV